MIDLIKAVVAVTFVFGMLTSCANVQPYEREHLADPIMGEDDIDETVYEQHLHRALSQGLAGQPVSGAGCGCEQ
tara:strand:- start:7941 stop:8162 length:222 start_codon:yes stop_codon:yes gene_type:complete